MNKNIFFTFISLIIMTFIFAGIAEAKRFGGGSSFGGKKSYSSPFSKKSSSQKSFSQQKAASTNQQRKQQMSKRGGLMGMLGGLALGGLLGALFFGGAFENLNMFDFLIIGGIIFAVYWFMKRKALSPRTQAATPGGFSTDMGGDETKSTQNDSQFKLNSTQKDASFSDNETQNTSSQNKKDASFADSFGMDYGQDNDTQTNQSNTSEGDVILPDWFNQEEFLSGARSAYTTLQQAWDKGDLTAIKELTTDEVYNEISRQITQEPPQGKTRIVQLNAELIDFNDLADRTEVSVLFDALLDETAGSSSSQDKGRASQVRELWHFIRASNSNEPTWYLDGIQQLE